MARGAKRSPTSSPVAGTSGAASPTSLPRVALPRAALLVAALIEAQALPREFAVELHVSVRPLFVKLWEDVQGKRAAGLA